jgi:outer membrane receptor protein involved in Fe transport
VGGAARDTIPSYAVVDARVGYEPRWAPGITISLDARNLLDQRHRELVGAPQLGRLVVSRVQARF